MAAERIRVRVPLGDARARRSTGERPGGWTTCLRALRRHGPDAGEITWRGFPYPVRLHPGGEWRLELYGPATARLEEIRTARGRAQTLRFVEAPPGRRRGLRPTTAGYALVRGRYQRVGRDRRGRLTLL